MQSPRVSSPGLSGSSFAIAPCEDMYRPVWMLDLDGPPAAPDSRRG